MTEAQREIESLRAQLQEAHHRLAEAESAYQELHESKMSMMSHYLQLKQLVKALVCLQMES